MPTVNIYKPADQKDDFKEIIPELKSFIARELTVGELALTSKEVSVRVITVAGSMIGDVEIEIKAHMFAERVSRQDDICNAIRDFSIKKLSGVGDVRVWLVLSELGHSW